MILFLNCPYAGDKFWGVVIDIDNQSNKNIIIYYEACCGEKKILINANSKVEGQINNNRYSHNEKLSDNFKYLKVLTEENQLILDLRGNELNEKIPYYKNVKGDDYYLLVTTNELINGVISASGSKN